MLLWDHAEAASRERGYGFAVSLILGALFVNFIEPVIRQRLAPHPADPDAEDHGPSPFMRISVGTLALGALLGLLFELIHSAISHEPEQFLRTNFQLLIESGFMTYGWVRGARARPPRAMRDGLVYGALGGLVSGLLAELVIGAVTSHTWQALPPLVVLAEMSRRVAPAVAYRALGGLAGGYLLERVPYLRGWGPLGIPVIALVIPAVLDVVAAVIGGERPSLSPTAGVALGRLVAVGAGWAFGLLLCPGAIDRLRASPRRSWGVAPAWATAAVLGYVLLSGNLLYRWFPNGEPLFEASLTEPRWNHVWLGTCDVRDEHGTLAVVNPHPQCEITLVPEPTVSLSTGAWTPPPPGPHGSADSCATRSTETGGVFVTPVIISVTLSIHLREDQWVGLTYWDRAPNLSYTLWLRPDRIGLVRAVGRPETPWQTGSPVTLAGRKLPFERHRRYAIRLEILDRLVRVQVNDFPVMSAGRPEEGCLAGDVTLSVAGSARVELHDLYVDRWLGSRRPF